MLPGGTGACNEVGGNGRSAQENQFYATSARGGVPRDAELRQSDIMVAARRRNQAQRAIARDGESGPEALQRLADAERVLEITRAKAVALTARRRAQQAAAKAAEAEAVLNSLVNGAA